MVFQRSHPPRLPAPAWRLCACVALAALLGLAGGQPVLAQGSTINNRKNFDKWMAQSVHYQNGNVLVGCWTVESSRPQIELLLLKRVGDCANTSVRLSIADDSQEGRRPGKQPVQGQLQVDSLAAHTIQADYLVEPGDKFRVFYVRVYDNPRAVMQELASGQAVRLSFTHDQREQTFQFSLQGYAPAYEHIKQVCAAPQGAQAAPKPKAPASVPSQAKPKAPSRGGDADFFPGSSGGSGAHKGPKSDKDYF